MIQLRRVLFSRASRFFGRPKDYPTTDEESVPGWHRELVFAAGITITSPMADFTDHYGLQPGGHWTPRGQTSDEIGKEVDTMIVAIAQALAEAQSLMRQAYEHPQDK